jgi:hypothetical protein
MRKSYEGLAGLVRNGLDHDIMPGTVFMPSDVGSVDI